MPKYGNRVYRGVYLRLSMEMRASAPASYAHHDLANNLCQLSQPAGMHNGNGNSSQATPGVGDQAVTIITQLDPSVTSYLPELTDIHVRCLHAANAALLLCQACVTGASCTHQPKK